jgi:hypothetical protein
VNDDGTWGDEEDTMLMVRTQTPGAHARPPGGLRFSRSSGAQNAGRGRR